MDAFVLRPSFFELIVKDANPAVGGGGILDACGSGFFSNKCAGALGFGRSAGISSRLLSTLKSLIWRKNKPGVSMWEVARKISFEELWESS